MNTTTHNRFFSRLIAAISTLALVVVGVVPSLPALAVDPLDVISYQGRLLNANGVPVTDASLEMVFRFYDDIAAGSCLWESDDGVACDGPDETQTVALTDGLFSENIGSTDDPAGLSEAYPVDLTGVFEDNANVFLEVQIAGETLSPRKRVVATPFALNSQTLDGLDSTEVLFTGSTQSYDLSSAKLLTATPLAFDGATAGNGFETTFLITDPSADNTITFQDASGTVAFTTDIPAGSSLWESDAVATFEDDDDVVVGTTGVAGETIDDAGFILNGNDFFVAGDAGVEGDVYTDGDILMTSDGVADMFIAMSLPSGPVDWAFGSENTVNGDFVISRAADLSNPAITIDEGVLGVTLFGDLVIKGGDLNPGIGVTTFNLLNSTSTTINFAGAATTLEIGATTGTTSINNALTVDGNTTLGNGVGADLVTINTASSTTNAVTVTANSLDDDDVFGVTANALTTGSLVDFATSGTFSGNLFQMTATGAASGTFINLISSDAGTATRALNIDFEETTATQEIMRLVTDVGGNDIEVFSIEADGEVFSSVGFTVGATTTYADGSIQSSGPFSFNTTANQAITTGTGLFTAAGALTVNGNTTIGNAAADALTVNAEIRNFTGNNALEFEGATDDGIYTIFAITDPDAERTITFQNGSGTVAFLSDVGGSGGWTDDGTTVRLTTATDLVAIGTATADGILTVTNEIATNDIVSLFDNDVGFFTGDGLADGTPTEVFTVLDGGNVGIFDATPTGELEIHDRITGVGTSDGAATLTIASLAPTGGDKASIHFSLDSTMADIVRYAIGADETVGGTGALQIGTTDINTNTFLTIFDDTNITPQDYFVINEGGADHDFRIEGDTNADMFNIDAGTDTMALGSAVSADTSLFINFPALTVSANGDGYYTNIIPQLTESTAVSTHDRMFGVNIEGLQLNDDGDAEATTTNAATLHIGNAPIGLTPTTTSAALWVEMSAQNDSTALRVDHSSTYFADATMNGPAVNISRSLLEDDFDVTTATLDVGAPVLGLSSTMTEGVNDVINDSSSVLSIFQLFQDATGPVVDIETNANAADILYVSSTAVTGATTAGIRVAFAQDDDGDATDVNAAIAVQTNSSSGDAADVLYGINIAALTGAATSTTHALHIGDAWDTNIFLDDTTSIFRLANTATLTFDDGTNTLMTLTDNAAVGDLDVSGVVQLDLNEGGAGVVEAVCGQTDGGGANETLESCGNAPVADYMEMYPVDSGVAMGDLVAVGATAVTTTAGDTMKQLVKTTGAYQADMIGIVSNPADSTDFNSIGYNINAADNPMPIALNGRVLTHVSAVNGAIQAGDPITSSSTAGVGMKSTAPGQIVGYALDSWSGPGQGTIMVFVSPGWHSGSFIANDGTIGTFEDDFAFTSTGTASAVTLGFDSHALSLRGSGWDGAAAQAVAMKIVNDVTDATDYRLSIRNTSDTEVAYVTDNGLMRLAGDLVIGGKLYPSDQGTAQTSSYIYYDSTGGGGGDRMRTNASGWGTGSYDFAEMFPSLEQLVPGDVVVFSAQDEHVERSTAAYNTKLAGIVSTRPGFLAGENLSGDFPIALAGRVPTKVNTENGSIEVGDPLTSSSQSGYAMKATQAGPIVGYALEPYSASAGQDDAIIVFVNVSYYGGEATSSTPGAANTASQIGSSGSNSNFSSLNMDGDIYMHGHHILDVGRMTGIASRWSIEEDGTVKTEGVLKTIITSYQNEKVETAAVTSPDVMITLVGTGELQNGQAVITFEATSPTFNDVTSTVAPVRVVVTPNGPVSLYVTDKSNNGFTVQQIGGMDTGITFDWMVSAYRKDYEPAETLIVGEETTVDPAATDPVVNDPAITDPAPVDPAPTDPAVADPTVTDPAPADPTVTEPAPVDPVPTDPTITDPAPVDPAPVDPAPTDPAPSESPTTPPADSTTPVDGGTPAETPTAP